MAVRVLHIVGASRYGGIYGVLRICVRMAREHGLRPVVLTDDPIAKGEFREMGVEALGFGGIEREVRPHRDWKDARRLVGLLRRERFCVVHTHTSKGGIVGRYAARKAGVPVILHTAHGFACHEFSPKWYRVLVAALESRAAKWCDRLIVMNRHDEEFARRFCHPGKLVHIPNGVANHAAGISESGAGRDVLLRQAGIPEKAMVIGNICRLFRQKNLEQFIRTIALLPNVGGRPVYGLIIGDGELLDPLRALARSLGVSNRIIFPGFRREAVLWLEAMDLFLNTSRWEGMSMSLLEAMSASKPIVATRIKGNVDCLEDGVRGLVVPVDDAEATARACKAILEDLSLAARLGQRAREAFLARYSEDVFKRNMWEKVYLPVLKEKGLAG